MADNNNTMAGTPIWWCEEHGANGDGPLGDGPKPQALYPCCLVAMLAACEDVDLAKPCHMVEVELHPVGSRVAGPDDLLIRRENGKWPHWALLLAEPFEVFVAGDGGSGIRPRHNNGFEVLDALAAAEGEESE